MKRRKTSLFVALALTLSFVLSPVNVFADELDTPVHEDPIDEIVYDNGTSTKNFSLPFQEWSSGDNKTLTFSSQVTYTNYWEEDVAGGISAAVFFTNNVKISGENKSISVYTHPVMPNHSVFTEYKITFGNLRFKVAVTGDAWGDVTHTATITATH